MKQTFLLFIILAHTILLSGQDLVSFKIGYSEPYATYDFLTKVSDNYPDNHLKTLFLNSRYHTEAFKKQVTDFQQLTVDYNYSFKQYPLPLKAGVMTRDMLEKNLATSTTVAEFRTKSLGLIPNEDLSAFADLLEQFVLLYRELVFTPNQDAFTRQKNNLQQYVNTNQFTDYFRKGLRFYHTQWDKNIPFELCLLPSFEKNNVGARAFINIAVCEASLDLKDYKILFSVAMHEIYHIIYDNQSLAMKKEVQRWFDATKSENSQYALLLMNEVLATALGNAYITEQLKGKIEEDDWYDNYYITAMAKEIYPLVKKYLQEDKPMDETFVKAYVHIYDTKFPQWRKELNHLMSYRYIVADQESDWGYFRKTYRKYSNSRLGAPISADEIENSKAFPITKVYVIAKNHRHTLNLIRQNYKELSGANLNDREEFIKVVDLEDRTKLIIINRHTSSAESLMNKYFPNKVIP